ncbi:MAG: hypothetical protein ACTHYM_13155 [Actinomycetaceae bacterium]
MTHPDPDQTRPADPGDGLPPEPDRSRPDDAAAPAEQAAPAPQGAAEEAGSEPGEPGERPTTVGHVRRAPRYGRFIWVGFLLGLLASILLVVFTDGESFSDQYGEQVGGNQFFTDRLSDSNAIGLLVVTLGPAGMILGAFVAYLLDRRSLRRRERATRGLTD